MARKPNPDNILSAELHGTALRLAREGGSIRDAVEALDALSEGRQDLAAHCAGIMLGSWQPRAGHPGDLIAAGLLATVAGRKVPEMQAHIEAARERASQPHIRGPWG